MSGHSTLAIHLLGRVDVRADGAAVRIGGRHAQALLALLALRPRRRLRDTLAAELWPEAGVPSAASMRQALWLIRSSLASAGLDADRWLEADQDTLGLHRDIALELDVDRFERLAMSDSHEDHELALRLYAGELVEGLGHECFAAERERLSDLFEDLLAEVAQHRLDGGDFAGARRAASELLLRDPLREEAHVVLIAAYGRTGTRAQVVRQYRRVSAILRAELAVAPLPETDAAYRLALAIAAARSHERCAAIHVAKGRFDGAGFAPALAPSA